MDKLIELLNRYYDIKILPLINENKRLKEENERYRNMTKKAIKERNALRNICKLKGWIE